MYVLHSEVNVMAEGPTNSKIPGNPISFYVNPIGIQSMILSATELSNSTTLTAEDPLPFSANAVLRPRSGSHQSISFPVVQGMGYVTGVYTDLQPVIQTGVLFQKVVSAGSPKPGIFKYRAHLEDGSIWLVYASPNDGRDPGFRLESHTDLRGPKGWSGTIQVAKNPAGSGGEKLFDNSAGVFAVEGVVSGAVDQKTGVYSLGWAKAGKHVHSTPLMMFALPHHVSSFDRSTQGRMTDIHLRATTKGNTTAVIGEQWTMIEPDLPIDMGFAPWSTDGAKICPAAKKAIRDIAPKDLEENIDKQTDLNSMYFSGKALSKFATLVYTVSELGEDPSLAASALEELKNSFARFVDNRQQFPLVYDNVWKGVVSSASYGGDVGADFGTPCTMITTFTMDILFTLLPLSGISNRNGCVTTRTGSTCSSGMRATRLRMMLCSHSRAPLTGFMVIHGPRDSLSHLTARTRNPHRRTPCSHMLSRCGVRRLGMRAWKPAAT